jgi:hypothetical protein
MAPQARLKIAEFHVRATMAQSIAWKRAAEAEGHASVGTWAAEALDIYLKARARSGKPLPLYWSRGRFRVRLENGAEPELPGWIARPFGIFRGTDAGPGYHGCHVYTLVHLPTLRLVATFRYARHCKALASELARLWVRWGGTEPAEDPAPLLQRFQREDI